MFINKINKNILSSWRFEGYVIALEHNEILNYLTNCV